MPDVDVDSIRAVGPTKQRHGAAHISVAVKLKGRSGTHRNCATGVRMLHVPVTWPGAMYGEDGGRYKQFTNGAALSPSDILNNISLPKHQQRRGPSQHHTTKQTHHRPRNLLTPSLPPTPSPFQPLSSSPFGLNPVQSHVASPPPVILQHRICPKAQCRLRQPKLRDAALTDPSFFHKIRKCELGGGKKGKSGGKEGSLGLGCCVMLL
ncbi:hypothetical protein BJ508DRAFT_139778 [Ascobolus immersus RN42]|uniref:Uncharacterized protein n=1 Tax=Ascobolus immersus RN42 TaxID=1160509 RepID=A0A3N4I0D2_ASCIM|nr:hypothetical protein BJ508DRAFT_139778 [Ascobolus immersus RN42]